MAATLTSAICIVQIVLLLALTLHDMIARRRQIAASLRHTGWLASTRGLAPMRREPPFGGDGGAIVYLLPERPAGVTAAPLRHVA